MRWNITRLNGTHLAKKLPSSTIKKMWINTSGTSCLLFWELHFVQGNRWRTIVNQMKRHNPKHICDILCYDTEGLLLVVLWVQCLLRAHLLLLYLADELVLFHTQLYVELLLLEESACHHFQIILQLPLSFSGHQELPVQHRCPRQHDKAKFQVSLYTSNKSIGF